MKGRQKSGKSFLKDNLFFVDSDQFFYTNKKEMVFARQVLFCETFRKTRLNYL